MIFIGRVCCDDSYSLLAFLVHLFTRQYRSCLVGQLHAAATTRFQVGGYICFSADDRGGVVGCALAGMGVSQAVSGRGRADDL